MNIDLTLALTITFVATAVAIVWIRAKIAIATFDAEVRGRTAADVEMATLNERLSNVQSEVARLKTEKSAIAAELDKERVAVDELQKECSTNKVHVQRATILEQHNDALLARIEAATEESAKHREVVAQANEQVNSLTTQRDELRALATNLESQRDSKLMEISQKSSELAELGAKYVAECSQSAEKLLLLSDAKAQLTEQFQNLANQILEEKSQRFTQKNQENIGALLGPLQERIKEFQQQVATTYDVDSKERLTLKSEIERLAKLNVQVSTDAHNLTNALKGSVKTQGNWGEMLLEQVLDLSGLRKNEQYFSQETFVSEDGRQQRPDVVIHVPGGRHLIVDSKVSLVAYERYCNAPDEAAKNIALKEHLASLRNHVK